MTTTIVAPMTQDEARRLVTDIRAHLTNAERQVEAARQKALRLYQSEGWKPLGYSSFRACAEAEFGRSWQQIYRLVDAAQVDANLALVSPTGEIEPVRETHARELKRLPTPQAQHAAYLRAQEIAQSEGDRQPTVRHIQAAVSAEEAALVAKRNALVYHLVVTGDLSPRDGSRMVNAMEKLPPRVRGDLTMLIATHGLRDVGLIAPIGDMLKRKGTPKESKILPEVVRGFLGGVPLRDATVRDLERAADEARMEHIAEAQELKRQEALAAGMPVIEPVAMSAFINAPDKTVKALASAFQNDRAQLEQVWFALGKHLGWRLPGEDEDVREMRQIFMVADVGSSAR